MNVENKPPKATTCTVKKKRRYFPPSERQERESRIQALKIDPRAWEGSRMWDSVKVALVMLEGPVLKSKGLSLKQISEELSVSSSLVYRAMKKVLGDDYNHGFRNTPYRSLPKLPAGAGGTRVKVGQRRVVVHVVEPAGREYLYREPCKRSYKRRDSGDAARGATAVP